MELKFGILNYEYLTEMGFTNKFYLVDGLKRLAMVGFRRFWVPFKRTKNI